jgi:hypothetical protein
MEINDVPPSKTITFAEPIRFDGRDYTEIVLREPRIGEMRQANEQLRNGVTSAALDNRAMHLISKVTGIPFPVVERLPVSAANEAMVYLGLFINSSGPVTGQS